MKCPKCGYLGFESVDRCRNCGYEFSLAPSALNIPELPLRIDESVSPLEDLALIDSAFPAVPAPLPFFSIEDDAPLITRASPPRAPLAVRRTPDIPKVRPTPPPVPMLDLSQRDGAAEKPVAADGRAEPAALAARLSAFLVDALILSVVDAMVVYFTMQICGLTFDDLPLIPRGPLIGFLVFQNLGYLVAFTAGGQTLGKMAAGIRVVPVGGDASVELGSSVVRTVVWLVLAIPAGLGFLSTLLTSDRRGLHDRLSGTRVVRASV